MNPKQIHSINCYPGIDGWITGTRYQCMMGYSTIYARSEKSLAKKLRKLGVELPKLHAPIWTGIGTQHSVYSAFDETDALTLLKERYDG